MRKFIVVLIILVSIKNLTAQALSASVIDSLEALADKEVRLGESAYQTQHYDQADKHYTNATNTFLLLARTDPDRFELLLAATLLDYAALCFDMSDYQRAESFALQSLAIRRKYAVQKGLSNSSAVAIASGNLGILYLYQKQFSKAKPHLEEALSIFNVLAETDPEQYEPWRAKYLIQMAAFYREQYDFAKAEKFNQEGVALYRRLAIQSPEINEPELSGALVSTGNTYLSWKKFDEAENAYTEALQIHYRLVRKDSTRYEPELANILNSLASCYIYQNKLDRGEEMLLQSIAIRRRLAALDPALYEFYLAISLGNMGVLLCNKKEYARSIPFYEESIGIRRRQAADNPQMHEPDLATQLIHLGSVYNDLGEPQRALPYFEEALEIRRRLDELYPEVYRPLLADLLMRSGDLYVQLADSSKAEKAYLESIGVYANLLASGADHFKPGLSETLNSLGMLYLAGKSYDSALSVFDKQKEILEKPGDEPSADNRQDLAYCYNNIATAQLGLGKLDPARVALDRSRQLDPGNSWLYRNLACYYALKNDPEAAVQNLSKAADLGYDDPEWLAREKSLDSVRKHPRFKTIAARIAKNAEQ